MSECLPYFLYDAFSCKPFGGSQAAIVLNASSLAKTDRVAIAKELGYPATVFVSQIDGYDISAQFYSTVAELPMCGHGTVALMACLVDQDLLQGPENLSVQYTLKLPNGDAVVSISRNEKGNLLSMLQVRTADFLDNNIDVGSLCEALGIVSSSLSSTLPVETATADFTHLIVPIKTLKDMRALQPNFSKIASFYGDFGVETVTAICTSTESADTVVRIRDFCPAVGVAESAAAGTTNAAVAGFLHRHGQLTENENDKLSIIAEQGIEISRPSQIHSQLLIQSGCIASQWVGGVACRVASGQLDILS